jgi:hypothetical protein
MNIIPKIWIAGIFSLLSNINNGLKAQERYPAKLTDSNLHSQKIREVLTSRQLFTIDLSSVNKRPSKGDLANFKAELRDAFKVILYEKDTSFTELNWAMCPDGKCPAVGMFKSGTLEYMQVDAWINQVRKRNVKMATP